MKSKSKWIGGGIHCPCCVKTSNKKNTRTKVNRENRRKNKQNLNKEKDEHG